MALGLKTESTGGDFLPRIKYDARAGKLFRVDRVHDGKEWFNNETEITSGFKAVFDLENIEVGWMAWGANGAPDFRFFPLKTDIGAPPTPGHKDGFRLMIKLSADCGGDVREFCHNANVAKKGMNALHDAYLVGTKVNPGKLPVVVMTSTQGVTTGAGQKKSTNYVPIFEIKGWVARPSDLTPGTKTNGHAASVTPAAPSQPAPSNDAEDFG